jgi:HEAT repeat protein
MNAILLICSGLWFGSPAIDDVTTAPLSHLAEALSSAPDLDSKLRAIAEIARRGPDAVRILPAVVKLATDKEPRLRRYAMYAIKQMGMVARAGVPALVAVLTRDSDEETRCIAADALGRIASEAQEARPAVAICALITAPAIDGGGWTALACAPQALLPADTIRDLIPAVTALASTLKEGEVGAHASLALRRMGPLARSAQPELTRALQNKEVRAHAAQTLAHLGLIEPLAEALKDKDEDLRVEAVLALGLAGKAGVPALRTALADREVDVRLNAVVALGKIGPASADATGDLAKLLKDMVEEVRLRAARALGSIGPAAAAALPALEEASKNDKAQRVKEAAEEAIEIIRKKR